MERRGAASRYLPNGLVRGHYVSLDYVDNELRARTDRDEKEKRPDRTKILVISPF